MASEARIDRRNPREKPSCFSGTRAVAGPRPGGRDEHRDHRIGTDGHGDRPSLRNEIAPVAVRIAQSRRSPWPARYLRPRCAGRHLRRGGRVREGRLPYRPLARGGGDSPRLASRRKDPRRLHESDRGGWQRSSHVRREIRRRDGRRVGPGCARGQGIQYGMAREHGKAGVWRMHGEHLLLRRRR